MQSFETGVYFYMYYSNLKLFTFFLLFIFHSWCTCISMNYFASQGYLSSALNKVAQGWNQNKCPYGLL